MSKMITNEESAKPVIALLETMGFLFPVDGTLEFNLIHLERDFGELGYLVVWARSYTGVLVGWSQGYEKRICLVQTADIAVLERTLRQTIDFIERLSKGFPGSEPCQVR